MQPNIIWNNLPQFKKKKIMKLVFKGTQETTHHNKMKFK